MSKFPDRLLHYQQSPLNPLTEKISEDYPHPPKNTECQDDADHDEEQRKDDEGERENFI